MEPRCAFFLLAGASVAFFACVSFGDAAENVADGGGDATEDAGGDVGGDAGSDAAADDGNADASNVSDARDASQDLDADAEVCVTDACPPLATCQTGVCSTPCTSKGTGPCTAPKGNGWSCPSLAGNSEACDLLSSVPVDAAPYEYCCP